MSATLPTSTRPSAHATVDYEGFAREVTRMRREIMARLGPRDYAHLRRVERWGRLCSVLGYATAWIVPNPLSALLISQGNLTRWLLMHHIGHRGYDRVPGVRPRHTSKRFALGWRRFVDWFDWIVPEAWCYEHNVLHHYHTGDKRDPDLVERNVVFLRRSMAPMWARYVGVLLLALTWKLFYYAPNTLMHLQAHRRRRAGLPVVKSARFYALFNPFAPGGLEFWRRCILPYGLARFVAIPALFLPLAWVTTLGVWPAIFVLANSILAEAITNVHAFIIIGPNHTGDDLFRFDRPLKDKREFFARQVLGSVNYACGTDAIDYPQAWLNYQIEHHLWPDIPLSQYQQVHAATRELCERYGLVYRQEPVHKRVKKLIDIMVGKRSMRRTRYLVPSAEAIQE